MTLSAAEVLLQDLGVTTPAEIDLEAIAYHVGAEVRYRALDGCEARIIGTNERAIITVNTNGTWRRKRFSIAHELGHWHHHRGRRLACRVDDIQPQVGATTERVADSYAASLLMPNYLFRPLARRQKKFDFAAVQVLADTFDASLTATAIRLVEGDYCPSILICHGMQGLKWFTRSPSVPRHWFPQSILDPESYAFDIQFGSDPDSPRLRKIGADAWFDRNGADRFEVFEQTVRAGPGITLTLLVLSDEDMLEEGGRF